MNGRRDLRSEDMSFTMFHPYDSIRKASVEAANTIMSLIGGEDGLFARGGDLVWIAIAFSWAFSSIFRLKVKLTGNQRIEAWMKTVPGVSFETNRRLRDRLKQVWHNSSGETRSDQNVRRRLTYCRCQIKLPFNQVTHQKWNRWSKVKLNSRKHLLETTNNAVFGFIQFIGEEAKLRNFL